ncbi:MAG: GIY-YIG nuclease family protein [Alphaproteobacteria bacterium]|nr:GIY-YIG nuclease family protein [Alphaproteobacteria bacterium]
MVKEHRYFVYLLASKPQGTLYVGVTSNLAGRIHEHKEDLRDGFTKKYGVHRLVWFEEFAYIQDAILREKRIKKWRRSWKIELIEKANPGWSDLFEQVV